MSSRTIIFGLATAELDAECFYASSASTTHMPPAPKVSPIHHYKMIL